MAKRYFHRLIVALMVFMTGAYPVLAIDNYVVVDDIVFVRPTPGEVLPQEKLHGDEAYQNAGDNKYFFYGENIEGSADNQYTGVINVGQSRYKFMQGSEGWKEYYILQNGYIDKTKLWKEPPVDYLPADRVLAKNNLRVYLLPDKNSKVVLELYKGEVMDVIGQITYNGEIWAKVQTISANTSDFAYNITRYGYIPEKDIALLSNSQIDESSLAFSEIPAEVRYTNLNFPDKERKRLSENGFYTEPETYLSVWNIPGSNYHDGRHSADDMADRYSGISSATFLTTDLYLHATHVIFDRMMADTEEYKLYPEIKDMTLKLVAESTTDLHNYKGHDNKILRALVYNVFFFSVAAKLLDPQFVIPPEVETDVKMIVSKIKNATGREIPSLNNDIKIGEEDYSQYKVRGHYASKHVTSEEQERSENINNAQPVQTQPAQEAKKPGIIVKAINKVKNVFKGWFGKKEDVKNTPPTPTPIVQSANAAPVKQPVVDEKDTSTTLERYFRAMIWYGRHTHLLSDDQKTLSAIFMVRQLESSGEMSRWDKIDNTLNKLIGKTDDYTPTGYKQVILKIYGPSPNLIASVEVGGDKVLGLFRDEVKKSLSKQKIVSMQTGLYKTQGDRLDMTAGFKFMGQRFTWDAYIFNQLSSPVVGTDTDTRNMPSALDIMYILGSIAAKKEMDNDVSSHVWDSQYHAQITKLQDEAKGELEKKDTSYNTWMYGIKTLFQGNQSKQYFAQTEAWQYKNLNTALSSWTELKHDTALYTEQSYAECGGEGPESIPRYKPPSAKGYVEPNPLLFGVLRDMIAGLLADKYLLTDEYRDKFTRLYELTDTAWTIAQKETSGGLITEEDYQWINKAKDKFDMSLLLPSNVGNYNNEDLTRMAIITDVATDAVAGEVLEVATGLPHRMFVVVKDAYGGTRITTGFVYSWYQFASGERLSDQQWRDKVYDETKSKELRKYTPAWYSKIER